MEILHVLLLMIVLECGIALPNTRPELPLNISFTLNLYVAGTCYGGTSAGLGSTDLRLEYRNNASGFQWVEIDDNIPIGGDFSTVVNIPGSGCVVVRLVQEEHGGGNCNCWRLTDITLNSNITTALVDGMQCGGSASVPRSVEWTYLIYHDDDDGDGVVRDCSGSGGSVVSGDGNCSDVPSVLKIKPFNTNCSESSPYINVAFQLHLSTGCDSIERLDEGVEFSICMNSEGVWIPITLTTLEKNSAKPSTVPIGHRENENDVEIRGYHVKPFILDSNIGMSVLDHSVQVCDFGFPVNSTQFRWLQTSQIGANAKVKDAWTLDNVHISVYDGNISVPLLQDSFNEPELNTTNWSPSNIRNGNVSTMCAADRALVFGLDSVSRNYIVSRSVKTNLLNVSMNASIKRYFHMNTPSPEAICTTGATTFSGIHTTTVSATPTTMSTTDAATPTTMSTTDAATPTTMGTADDATTPSSPDSVLAGVEVDVLEKISDDSQLNDIYESSPAEALKLLADVVSDVERDDDEVVLIYLLGSILNRTTAEIDINDFVSVGNSIVENTQKSESTYNSNENPNVAGSSLLAIMDDYAFSHFEQQNSSISGNIVLQTRQLTTDSLGQEHLTTAIDSSNFPSLSQLRISIEIPLDLVRMFINMSGIVRLESFLYANVIGLFPDSLPRNNSELVSGVVSTALQCGTGRCPTDDLQLDTPVRITVEHSDTVKERLVRDSTSEIQCVFLEFLIESSTENSILSAGQWSERGCNRSESLSNTSVTVCECNHLTHFAILQSTDTDMTNTVDSTQHVITAADVLKEAEDNALNQILNDSDLRSIFEAPPAQALEQLAAVVSDVERDDDEVIVLYLLGSTLNRTTAETELPKDDFIGVGAMIIRKAQNNEYSLSDSDNTFNVEGSSLMAVIDDYIFNDIETEERFQLGNIALQTRQLTTDNASQEDLMTAIDSSDYPSLTHQPRMSIEIPPDLVRMFSNMSGMGSNGVRLGSFLYANVTGLFPSSLPGGNSTELASGIVSTGLQCGTGRCPTDDLQLDTPVRITIEHSDTVKERLMRDNTSEIQCVFLDFLIESSSDNSILSVGQWSERGCSKSESLSNTSVTVCECNHLTHFAILLSAASLNLTDAVVLSLEVIGYVGVSISLVAMALTIFTFVALKSLHNMRNYIHINLCISLGIVQLIFVAGVDRSASDHVPIHCQVIAVLLHYFFLVSFMWMLMEGVVLYVVLVRVFVKYKKRYLFAFTIFSYGIPLLYLGLLTLPLGFALPTQPNYGYNTVCFLNTETNFIWAFIAPVIGIILINVGFFIIAATIMWRQQKKQQSDSDLYTFKNWLKGAVSLVVIMGLTWILGVLIVEMEELVPLAYIYTIMVAFQGLFIFVIFVVLSKQVREAYAKCWREKVNKSDILSRYFGSQSTLKAKPRNRSATCKVGTVDHKQSNDYVAKDRRYSL